MDDEYLLLGYITGSFGLDGTVRILSKTYFAEKRYQEGNEVFIYNANLDGRVKAKVESFRCNEQFDFVKFDIINTKEEADNFKGSEVQVLKNSQDLDVGYYFFSDLENCVVIDEENNQIGKVEKVEEFPAQFNLRIKVKNGKQILVPFVDFFVKNVDIKNKTITIHVIEGML